MWVGHDPYFGTGVTWASAAGVTSKLKALNINAFVNEFEVVRGDCIGKDLLEVSGKAYAFVVVLDC